MRHTISKLIEIAFSEMNKKICDQAEIIKRQNEILCEMDIKIDAMQDRIDKLEKASINEDFDTGMYKYGGNG